MFHINLKNRRLTCGLSQKQIADYLTERCKMIDASIEKYQQIVDKLTVYKKSLIYEAVTGKLEV